jgi:uncharacterized protein
MEATIILRAPAASGDTDAQFRLGYRLAFHRNPNQRDWSSALRYWQSAAARGHVRAQFHLGTCFDFGPELTRALARRCAGIA